MLPDFSKTTIDTLAKRAGFLCSNPDCRVSTVGPNSKSDKFTTIGEAAHIYGARPHAARFDGEMSEGARAEITNAIWLCSNCHTQVDRDVERFQATLLFAWREEHERYVAAKLGSVGDQIRIETNVIELHQFKDYPPLIKRIVVDKPIGWEWRLTAELLRYLNRPVFRQLRDLKDGLYTRRIEIVQRADAFMWVGARLKEMSALVPPLEKLLPRLTESWGKPGEPGSVSEIHHVCLLVRDALEQIAIHEERLYFASIPDDYQRILELLKGALGTEAQKFKDLPDDLDRFATLIGTEHGGTKENPLIIEKIIKFDLPVDWERQMSVELKKLGYNSATGPNTINTGWWLLFFFITCCWVLYSTLS